ncbi:hypothetical protein [Piscirickettsia litoralis]|uniref:Uncharacterized protein n=1 Tax=Piscirickettsia litoralis TaxID=1891921 RepID=A0ABX3A013_9GAMM|nr:hypothetical protein [Piscirickettsia litoralis]ODN42199.1 hypothetical protein BGC07_03685 [Piscirickettsia litoralis]
MSTFINWVSTKAVFNYITRRSQGWKPTGKTAEAYISWKSAINSRKGLFAFAIAGLTLFVTMVNYLANINSLSASELVFMSPSVLFFLNMALVVMVFGRSRMQEQNNITLMSIENKNSHHYHEDLKDKPNNKLKKAS